MKRLYLFLLLSVFALTAVAQSDEDRWVDSVFNSLTIEQKVGQLINVRANNPSQPFMEYIDNLITNYNIGGVTFFRCDAEPLLLQANSWQSLAQTPMMVAIDGEWGLGMRLNDGISYPFQMTLGAIQNQDLISEMGQQIAEQCLRIGINVNLAPDVDVNNEPTNPVIGMRSFGEDPKIVAELGTKYALALQNNGVLPTMKHFPGHGDTKTDSHLTLPVVEKKLNSIKKTELYPFEYLIANGVAGAMVGHLYMPALEPVKNTSSSLSENVVTGLLKEEMGFKGLIFTDALDMKGAYVGHDPDSVALRALMAGNDVLLMPLNPQNSIQIIVNQAGNQEVYRRIEESCKKILRYKYRLGLDNYKHQSEYSLYNDLHKARYDNTKQHLYNEAITLLKNKNEVLPLTKDQNIAVIAFAKTDNMSKRFLADGYNVHSYLIDENLNKSERKRIIKELDAYDVVIVSIQNTNIFAYKNFGIKNSVIDFVKEISGKKRIVFDMFACPYAYEKFSFKKDPAAIIIGYEDNQFTINAAVDVMTGKQNPIGRLPVSIKKKFKKGEGLSYKGMLTPETLPVSIIDNEYTKKIDSIVLDGIAMQAYPGCQVLALKDGKVVYDKCFGTFTYDDDRYVQKDDLYDIASLTKVFATTFAVMKLFDDGKISLDNTLGDFFPYLRKTDKGNVKLVDIMTHQAGLTAWIPIYKNTIIDGKPDANIYRNCIDEDHTVRVAKDMYISQDYVFEIFELTKNSDMLPERKYKYSDLGFYYIPKIVELVTNKSFEDYLEENFYKPLNLNHIFFKPLRHVAVDNIAPTENDTVFRMQLLQGDVHDLAAALMGGVSGHAGLFANARDLAVMMQLLLDGGYANNRQFISEYTIRKFTTAPYVDNMNRRGIGFDKPEVDPSVPYYTPSKQSSMRSFGHTGFTGTFAWADPENNLVVIFLSNRVCPDASNNKLSQNDIRTKIHDMFYKAIK